MKEVYDSIDSAIDGTPIKGRQKDEAKSKSPVKDYLAISHNLDVPFKRIRGRA